MRNVIHSTTLAALLLLASTAARAGGYAIPAANARELGLAQATVASQTGPEAIYQNSSALAGHKGLSVSGSVEMLYNQTTWTGLDTGGGAPTATIIPKANFPPELAVSYGGKLPNGMNFGVGAGLLIPGGGSIFWPNNWPGASRIQTVQQKVFLFQVGGALQPIEMLKLGATFLYYGAQEKLTQKLNFLNGNPAEATLGLAGGTPSFGLSASIAVPGVPLNIGIDYRHQGAMTLSGKVHFNGVPPTFQGLLQDQNVTEAVTVPNELFVGAAYKVMPNLEVMASWSLERWVTYKEDRFVGDKDLTIVVPRNYKNAYVFRLGAEYTKAPFLEALTMRCGLLRSVSPQPTDTVSPSLTDGSSTGLNVGAGYNITANLRADIGYQFSFFDKVTASGPDAFPGSYATTVHLLSAGVTWRTDL